MMYKFNVGDLVVSTRPGATGFGRSILKVKYRKIWGGGDRNYHVSPVALPNHCIGYDEQYLRRANVLDHVKERFYKFFKRGYYSAMWQRIGVK
jgi:hypothetical protein